MKNLFLLIFSFLIIIGCSERTSLTDFSDDSEKNQKLSDTSYIPLRPEWTGFNNPSDILIGREPFIYVADTDNNRIVMMNLAGIIIGTRSIKKPVAIAQDYRMNLLVCGQLDTVINNLNQTLYVLMKYDLYASGHDISKAPQKLVFPKDSSQLYRADKRQLTGVAVFYDNSYLVTRTGPDNTSIFNPDNAIMKFVQIKDNLTSTYRDSLIGEEPNFIPLGTGLMAINGLSGITSFNKRNTEIITTQTGNSNFKVQWLRFISTTDYTGYENKFDPSKSNTDLYKPGRFLEPEDVTVDNNGNIFVIDAAKDSLFRFSSEGKEQFSFGGPKIFKSPKGVAFFDKTLYICDSGNNRILRFILSTDVN